MIPKVEVCRAMTWDQDLAPGRAQAAGISAGPLQEFLGNSLLRGLLTWPALGEPDANFADLTPERVSEYIFLTRSTVEDTVAQQQASKLAIEPQMVTIPAGSFLMGTPDRGARRAAAAAQGRRRQVRSHSLLDNEIGQHPIASGGVRDRPLPGDQRRVRALHGGRRLRQTRSLDRSGLASAKNRRSGPSQGSGPTTSSTGPSSRWSV